MLLSNMDAVLFLLIASITVYDLQAAVQEVVVVDACSILAPGLTENETYALSSTLPDDDNHSIRNSIVSWKKVQGWRKISLDVFKKNNLKELVSIVNETFRQNDEDDSFMEELNNFCINYSQNNTLTTKKELLVSLLPKLDDARWRYKDRRFRENFLVIQQVDKVKGIAGNTTKSIEQLLNSFTKRRTQLESDIELLQTEVPIFESAIGFPRKEYETFLEAWSLVTKELTKYGTLCAKHKNKVNDFSSKTGELTKVLRTLVYINETTNANIGNSLSNVKDTADWLIGFIDNIPVLESLYHSSELKKELTKWFQENNNAQDDINEMLEELEIFVNEMRESSQIGFHFYAKLKSWLDDFTPLKVKYASNEKLENLQTVISAILTSLSKEATTDQAMATEINDIMKEFHIMHLRWGYKDDEILNKMIESFRQIAKTMNFNQMQTLVSNLRKEITSLRRNSGKMIDILTRLDNIVAFWNNKKEVPTTETTTPMQTTTSTMQPSTVTSKSTTPTAQFTTTTNIPCTTANVGIKNCAPTTKWRGLYKK